MTKVLVVIMNSRERQSSYIQKLYGDPDQYAHKLSNDSFADRLPIHQNWLRFQAYKFFHYVSIDYNEQKVYCSNNYHGRLEYGVFIYKNETHTYYFDFMPDSKQVYNHLTFKKTFRKLSSSKLYFVMYTNMRRTNAYLY